MAMLKCDFCGGTEQVVIVVPLNKPKIKVCKHCYSAVKQGKARPDISVLCDCEQEHPGQEINNGNQLRWYCPVEDEWKQDVNA